MSKLSLPASPSGPVSPYAGEIFSSSWRLGENSLSVIPRVYSNDPKYGICLSHKLPRCIKELKFRESDGELSLRFDCGDKEYCYIIGMDGVSRLSRVTFAHDMPDMVLSTGIWTDEYRLELQLRFIETCYVTKICFDFAGKTALFREYSLFSNTAWIDTQITLTRAE